MPYLSRLQPLPFVAFGLRSSRSDGPIVLVFASVVGLLALIDQALIFRILIPDSSMYLA